MAWSNTPTFRFSVGRSRARTCVAFVLTAAAPASRRDCTPDPALPHQQARPPAVRGPAAALVDCLVERAAAPQLQALMTSLAAGCGLHLHIPNKQTTIDMAATLIGSHLPASPWSHWRLVGSTWNHLSRSQHLTFGRLHPSLSARCAKRGNYSCSTGSMWTRSSSRACATTQRLLISARHRSIAGVSATHERRALAT